MVPRLEIVRVGADGEVATRLLRQYYDELDARFPGGFDVDRSVPASAEELGAPHGAFLVAELGGDPVGCGAVRKLDEMTAEIKRMYIDPVARGHGVGGSLLSALEDAARALACRVVRLDTSAYLAEAVALYRSSGYREIPAYNDNAYAAHWFEKRLPDRVEDVNAVGS